MNVFVWLAGLNTLAAVTLAVIVFRAGPGRRENRILAMLLLIESSLYLDLFIIRSADAGIIVASGYLDAITLAGAALAYLLVMGSLDTPLYPVLGHRRAPVIAAGLWACFALYLVLAPQSHVVGLAPAAPLFGLYPGGYARQGAGAYAAVVDIYLVVLFLGLALALWAVWRSSGAARRRAKAYAAAFAIHDLAFAIGFLSQAGISPADDLPVRVAIVLSSFLVGGLLFMGVLAYGLLREQVLDIDLKIKLGISRGTVGTVIAGAAFLGSEISEYMFGVDRLVPALLIAAASAFALKPLVRLGNRIADRALPGVEDTDAYRGRRAREIYRAAYDSALQDGIVSEKERDVLEALARSLGLPKRTAKTIETENP